MKIPIPADVPGKSKATFTQNYEIITKQSGRLFLFACDQTIEHMHDDLAHPDIPADQQCPEHLFTIAQESPIGAMAAPLGLIARHAQEYKNISYIAKISSKTNLCPPSDGGPLSGLLHTVEEVLYLVRQGIPIRGIGLTIYLGSQHEAIMLRQAAQAIIQAHSNGLIAVLWMYLRGPGITNDQDPMLNAGAAGVAHALGADFVKIKPPTAPNALSHITAAAGNTGVICSGQSQETPEVFLKTLHEQLTSGASGCATGRNIFQRPLAHAVAITHAISALVHESVSFEESVALYKDKAA